MSHFPSIEEFNEGVVEPTGGPIDDEDDLFSRERAVLGNDADQFSASQFPALDDDGDLLGGDSDALGVSSHKFESSFPDLIADNEAVGPGGTITGSGAPYMPGVVNTNFPSSTSNLPEEEPEVIK
ncbi:hypothetical protein AA313_de0202614 [Arthrobotrys entomopaga]|nr:hypothetical protein AA313_de0202614 [Arthrobotrys entomopaga]